MRHRWILAALVIGSPLLLAASCLNGNIAPIAQFSANPTSGPSPLTVSFDASASQDSDGSIVAYAWDYGDGTHGTGSTSTHTYTTSTNRTFTVTLVVTDDGGQMGSATAAISVTGSPSGAALFFDNFDNGLNPAWSLASGNWEAQGGDLHLRDAGDGYAYVLGGSGWTNYSVEADVKVPENWWIELVLRAKDDLNKVSLAVDRGSLVFVTFLDGQKSNVESTRVHPGAPSECHVLVTAVGNQFNCYVNGTLRTHFESSTFPSGTAGVGSIGAQGRGDTTHRFDNFKVTALP